MKRIYLLIPVLFLTLTSCSKKAIYVSASIGKYPDINRFWALIQYVDYRPVEDAKVVLDSTTTIGFDGTMGGYYKEGMMWLTYDSTYTIQIEVEDYEDIFGTVEIPSAFSLQMESSIDEGDSLIIEWTHADSMETSPDQWRMLVVEGQDTLYHLGFARTENRYKIPSGIIHNDIDVTLDAIRFGELSRVYINSVFAGIVQRKKTVTVN